MKNFYCFLLLISLPLLINSCKSKIEKPYTKVEQMPEFIGGYKELMKYTIDNMIYPESAKEKGITGIVLIQCVVEKDGKISNVKVLKGIGGGCDEEAIKIIKNMPPWNPGKHNGVNVSVYCTIPLKFTLK